MNLPHNNIRAWLEEKEEKLSPYAVQSRFSRGRARPEEPCPVRTDFQRDRDRILHSKAFRRLKHKTQVFIAPAGDHYVTRLTHTLEVSQIARTIARSLNLNEDLTEAIALGHDLGHTPFGHVGEMALNELSPFGFRHNEQSLRVVDSLENEGNGLNLTWEVREGILNHSKERTDAIGGKWKISETTEGQICKIADMAAYINHDIDDAIRAGVVEESNLPGSAISVLGRSRSERINTILCDIIDCSWALREGNLTVRQEKPVIVMSSRVSKAMNDLREFLFQNVYEPSTAKKDSEKARQVVNLLYKYFIEHAKNMPVEFIRSDEPPARGVVDYIAGMTDQYALRSAEKLGLYII